MGFLVNATMKGYEVRGVERGTSKNGNEFRSIRVEAQDGRTAEISCTSPELFASVDSLRKANVCNFDVRLVAGRRDGRDYSYISLVEPPMLVVDDARDYVC